MERPRALALARARLFTLRALSAEVLENRADERLVRREEVGSGSVHCHLLVTRYAWTEEDGRSAVRVTVNVEDGGWLVLDETEVSFVRPVPRGPADPA